MVRKGLTSLIAFVPTPHCHEQAHFPPDTGAHVSREQGNE